MDIVQTIEINDTKRIQIYNDSHPTNPFIDFDTGCNAWVYSNKSITEYGDIEIPDLNRKQILDNLKEIKALLEVNSIKEIVEDNFPFDTDITYYINDALHDHISHESGSDALNAMSAVLTMAGIIHLNTSGSGHCQGDYHEILLTLTSSEDDLSEDKKTNLLKSVSEDYSCYRYGDVYGYIVEQKCDCCNSWNETENACWGFAGEIDSANYNEMIKQAKENETEEQTETA